MLLKIIEKYSPEIEVLLKICFWAFASGQKCTSTEDTDSLKLDLNYLYTYVLVALAEVIFFWKGTTMLITNQAQQRSTDPESTPMKTCLI